jgi:hypothetical protein
MDPEKGTVDSNKRGSVTVTVVLLLIVLVGFAAFAIDVGYAMVARNELQNAADASALAAMRKLGEEYSGLTQGAQLTFTADRSEIVAEAQAAAAGNSAAGSSIVVNDADVVIGRWDAGSKTLTPGLVHPDAVRVTTRRDSLANGPVPTLLAGVLGISSLSVSSRATAALTGLSRVPKSGLPLPVGISKAWLLNPGYCENPIKLYPTNSPEGCAGWNVYDEQPASANTLNSILEGLADGSYSSPETAANQSAFNFTGGTLTSVFDAMKALFDAMRVKNDGVMDMDDDPNTWTTAVPVYDWPDCSNPNGRDGPIPIVGFTTIVVKSVQTTPEKTINAQVVCDMVVAGSGGGPLPDTAGTIPNLVE